MAAAWLAAAAFTREPTATVLSTGDGDSLRVQDRGRNINQALVALVAAFVYWQTIGGATARPTAAWKRRLG